MTAPDVNADVRARFEAWAKNHGYTLFSLVPDDARYQRSRRGQYKDFAVQEAWEAYRAAHADRDAEVRELVERASMFTPDDVTLLREAVSRLPRRMYDAGANLAFRFEAALAKHTHQRATNYVSGSVDVHGQFHPTQQEKP